MSSTAASDASPPRLQRSAAIDAVRVVAVLAVVFAHAIKGADTYKWVYIWHVPVFFLLSGYLWRDNRDLHREARSRWRSLGVPYLSWLLIVGVFNCVRTMALGTALTPRMFLRMALGGTHTYAVFAAFWFVSALFFSALFMRAAVEISDWMPWVFACAGIAWAAFDPRTIRAVPLAAGLALPCVIFMCAGRQFHRIRDRIPNPGWVGSGCLAAGIIAVVLGVAHLDLKKAYLGTPIVSLVTAVVIGIGLLLVAEAIIPRLGARVGRAITKVALASLPIVFAHMAILAVLRPFGWPLWLAASVAWSLPMLIGLLAQRSHLASRLLLGR